MLDFEMSFSLWKSHKDSTKSSRIPLMLTSSIIKMLQNKEISIDITLLSKLQILFKLYQSFHYCHFLFQSPIQDTILHVINMIP